MTVSKNPWDQTDQEEEPIGPDDPDGTNIVNLDPISVTDPGDPSAGGGSPPPFDSGGGTAPVGGGGGGGGGGGDSTPVQQSSPGSTTANTPYGSVTIGDDVHQDPSDITTDKFESMFIIYAPTSVGTSTNGAIAGTSDPTLVRVNDNFITTEQGAYLRVGDKVEYITPTADHALQITYNPDTNNLNISNLPAVSH